MRAARSIGSTAQLYSPCCGSTRRRVLDRPRIEAAEAALSPVIVLEGAVKTPLIEVRPQAVAEMQFRERGFPQQKIAQAPFVTCANQEVDLAHRISAVIDFIEQPVEARSVELRILR